MTSLEQLRKQRNALLNLSQKRKSMDDKRRQEFLERKRLEAEIKALKNPRSTAAKASATNALRSFGKFIKTRAEVFNENLERMERQEKMKESRQRVKLNKGKRR